ncbi:MAG: hypothetical protein E6K68_06940 [Nitrospirae bacterium]|nr:MAG: hypothetical protein E6K68_06940 [Nitrospirota bacterium]
MKKHAPRGFCPFATTVALAALVSSAPLLPAQEDDVEVPPGTKLCDPAENVYGYYLVKSTRKPDGTQDVEYYRFTSLPDPKTGNLQAERQPVGFSAARIQRHPQYKDKLQIINPHTSRPDEFPYASCKQQ